jgi:hypothetical protein
MLTGEPTTIDDRSAIFADGAKRNGPWIDVRFAPGFRDRIVACAVGPDSAAESLKLE